MDQKSESQSNFSQNAVICVRHTQAAFADLLMHAGLGGARPTTVGRVLGLDKTLAWKVSRFSETADPLKAVKHIPGASGVEIVLKAAKANGIHEDQITAVREANQAFQTFVRQVAGDRRSFEAMLAAGGQSEKIDLEERRAFYRSGSVIWGVRAKVQFLTLCLKPSPTNPDRIDVLQLSGFYDFARLRSNVPWIIRRLWVSESNDKNGSEFRREPLYTQEPGCNALPMIPEFCSTPIPKINQFTDSNGVLYDEIAPGPVGNPGALTCVSGELYHSAFPMHWSPENTFGRYELMLTTPVEAVVFDVYLHSSLRQFGDFEQTMFGLLEDRPGLGRGKSHNSPMFAPEASLKLNHPSSPTITQCSKIRDYSRLINSSLKQADWGSIDEFRGYRSEIDFPPTPVCLTMQCPIYKLP